MQILLDNGKVQDSIIQITKSGEAVYTRPVTQLWEIASMKHPHTEFERIFVLGRRTAINNTIVDLWEGTTDTYVFPTTEQQMVVVSSSASDTSNGTGARSVHIHYLDGNYVEHEEIITLNGATPVHSASSNIFRINSFHITSVGSTGAAVGNVSLKNLGETITYGYISSGYNTSRQAIFSVPANKTCYITHWQASAGSSGNHFCQLMLRSTSHDGIIFPGVFLTQDQAGCQNNGTEIVFTIPVPIPEKTDVKISAISDASNANVIALGGIMGFYEIMTDE